MPWFIPIKIQKKNFLRVSCKLQNITFEFDIE